MFHSSPHAHFCTYFVHFAVCFCVLLVCAATSCTSACAGQDTLAKEIFNLESHKGLINKKMNSDK